MVGGIISAKISDILLDSTYIAIMLVSEIFIEINAKEKLWKI